MAIIRESEFAYSRTRNRVHKRHETEYIVTNFDGATLSLNEAEYVYSLRWNIETIFGFVKTELENFSGKTKIAVLQEFYATMHLANICLCFINVPRYLEYKIPVYTKLCSEPGSADARSAASSDGGFAAVTPRVLGWNPNTAYVDTEKVLTYALLAN